MRRDPDTRPAFTLVELLLVVAIVAVLTGLTLAAVQNVRAAAAAAVCKNNLRQLALALHQYHDAKRSLPPGAASLTSDHPFMTWLTHALPWVEQPALWDAAVRAYGQDGSFSSPPHRLTRSTPVRVFLCPTESRPIATPTPSTTAAVTDYLGVTGDNYDEGVLYYASRVRLSEITDGHSHTLMIGERPPSADQWFGWWYAGVGQRLDGTVDSHLATRQLNQTFRAPTCPFGPYRFRPGSPDDLCSAFHFWSRHAGGAHFAFADGSVRFLRYSADPLLPALATRAGGETVPPPD